MTLGIPPPFPFCEAWPRLSPRSSRWLTPGFQIFPHTTPLATTYAVHMPQTMNPYTTFHPPVAVDARARPPPAIPSTPVETKQVPQVPPNVYEASEDGSGSEYEYGLVMDEEWAAHFARRIKERAQAKKRTTTVAEKTEKTEKTKGRAKKTPAEPLLNPLAYEIAIGQLKDKAMALNSSRVDALERRLEHAFMTEFSNHSTVCLFNA
ncbi:hypothetical protein Ae201684P_011000 [Aphanomyces euteiches]|uniref:Uncharacterized protein n=1 Tax=Aphanomyces euteiches TaxID=100861 RepID=A0A6G0XYP2_9STRA|nr:hypothetical protein Ae201684_000163 [Aphanomyces euteiches]KAH9091455.1 hypothetical protein Ae201684P_011000 [Aphanomyces euteiches]KAH9136091.1 hypothetical protein AeRB84_018633 [Aphanomyces euteiches]